MVTAYYDPVARRLIHQNGLTNEDFKDGIRPHLLILNGMLLQVDLFMVDARMKIKNGPKDQRIPDLEYLDQLEECGPYDETQLTKLMNGFTDAAMPILKLEPEAEAYARNNLGRVIHYLVSRRSKLRFFKLRYGKSPEENGALVFGDFSNPERPVFLYPVFGLYAKCEVRGYVRWKPCHHDHEPELVPKMETLDALWARARARGVLI